MKPRIDNLNVAERAREKAASREADAHALASGKKSREQLRAENSAFGFPRERVRVDFAQVKPKR
jgi:hypothetical protein